MAGQVPGRSLSGYIENLLSPSTANRRRANSPFDAEEGGSQRWRPASPQLQRRGSFRDQENEGPGCLHADPGTQARKESSMPDNQWRNIVTHIAADYAKLGSEHKGLKAMYEDQQQELDELRRQLQGTGSVQGPRTMGSDAQGLEAGRLGSMGTLARGDGLQKLAVSMAELEIEQQAKEFFLQHALALHRQGFGSSEAAGKTQGPALQEHLDLQSRVAAQEDECRRLQECLVEAQAAASRHAAESIQLKSQLGAEVREREAMESQAKKAQGDLQSLSKKAEGDQEAHRRQLEKVVRERQLLALKADDLSTRAAQTQRHYEVALEQLERMEQQAEDQKDQSSKLQQKLRIAEERVEALQADFEHLQLQQKGSQSQLRSVELDNKSLKEKLQRAETEAEVVTEDKERLSSLLRITLEAFQYHQAAVFQLEGMKDLAGNLETELTEQSKPGNSPQSSS